MSATLARQLRIRAMVHVAGEPIPFFWPMRTFIYHNPLYGLEHLPFEQAVREGERLFHARGYLPRAMYQRYLAQHKVDAGTLAQQIEHFLTDEPAIEGIDLHRLMMTLLKETATTVTTHSTWAEPGDIHAALSGAPLPAHNVDTTVLAAKVRSALPPDCPVYIGVDELFGTNIGTTLDELVIKSCLDFFDEGQSVWQMPGREHGLFSAWSGLAQRNLRLFIRGLHVQHILAQNDTPESVISYVMGQLRVPEDAWVGYFTRSLARLHGWAGFIRWRSGAKHYHWGQRYPADLVDYLAIRLVLGLALLREHAARLKVPGDAEALARFIDERPAEAYLRREFYGRHVLPTLAHAVGDAIASGRQAHINKLLPDYLAHKRADEAYRQAGALRELAARAGLGTALSRLTADQLGRLLAVIARFERAENQMWLAAHEAHYLNGLAAGLNLREPPPRAKRPFAQMLFCIDARSERIRRHLERIGDYQTFGIAGFFGIPVSFIGLDKGSETHLCPVVVTPKNLVLELAIARNADDQAFVSVLEHVLHDLKASVLSPYITVEAIGLLFGLDMFGKTLAPLTYNRWRARLYPDKPNSRLLLDKITREQADSVIRALQRALIVKALGRELSIAREAITDEMIRELRETALGDQLMAAGFAERFKLSAEAERHFIERLRSTYRVNRHYAQIQLERLGRIGFTLDEQVNFVAQALRSIGLTSSFSRFVLLAGHGSTTENNPYESALDCGACGGNHGIISARVLAQIANKPVVRDRLRAQGIDIPDDAWFIPAFHNTTTDELRLYDLDLLPASHLVYVERLSNGLQAAAHLCAAERLPALDFSDASANPMNAYRAARRNALDWSQVRPEWGLSRNAAFIIGRRQLTQALDLEGRAFLHSYDYRCDPRGRLLETILSGPLVVGQWINMEHYFSAVDNTHYGSGSKVYHNIAGHFGVMTGNLSDLRTGLPAQTVLKDGMPYHEPVRLLTVIEAPFDHARRAINSVANVNNLVRNGWVRMAIADPDTQILHVFEDGTWRPLALGAGDDQSTTRELAL